MSSYTPARPSDLAALDTITVSLVARQSSARDENTKSVEDQIAGMREFCDKQTPAWVVGAIYEERDVSGQRSLEKRHGLLSAVEDCESGRSQMIVTAYFDRYVRSVKTRADVVERVEAAGAQVMTLDFGLDSNATAAQWLNGNMLAMFAEFIARQTGEKTAMSKQRNIDAGICPFPRITPAYVKREDGKLEQSEFGPLVAEACRMRANGTSYVQLTKWLNENGVRTTRPNGQLEPMTPSGVESMLSSKLLIGEIHFGSFRPNLNAIENPVIDRATFRKMHATHVSRGRYSKSERLLARQGILVCATCGSRMTVMSTGTSKYAYYRCGERVSCPAPASVAVDVAEDLVRDEAIKLGNDVVGRASALLELEDARVAAAAAEQKLETTIMTLLSIESAATAEVLATLQRERDAAVARHDRLVALSAPDLTLRTATDWNLLTLAEKRSVVRATVLVAVVAPGRGADRVSVYGRETFGK